ncbi:MAG: cobalamin B12-binding domain-containing protein [Chloroflexi bacterium]|nr:cobalamin B12-binding domain-containing protein [Chloroflexota bacterium]
MTTDRIRVLIVKSSLDGHWRGVATVAAGLKDAGMDVIYGGMLTPPEIAKAAIEEDVDVLGINVGGRLGPIRDLLHILRQEGIQPLVVVGGPIPREDFAELRELGIEGIFPPGSTIKGIADFIKGRVRAS